MTAPPLETPRLLLNAHTLADFEPMAAMWADPVVNRHIGPPATRYETWKRLLRYGGYWPLLGYGSWAVREKATSRFIGDAGFRGLWQAGHIATDGAVEAGWVLAAWAHGQGFGSEALTAVLAWLDTQSRLTRAVCLIHPANTASIRLATRHGFGAARTSAGKGQRSSRAHPPAPLNGIAMDHATSSAPRLETERLVLQAHGLNDFADLSALWSDPLVLKHISFAPQGKRENWMRLLRYAGMWPLFGYGFWAVRHKQTGRYAGNVGFGDLCREIEPSIDGIPEGGWVFATWAHGQGIAGEALTAALNWLDTQTAYTTSVCLIAPENAASLRLAARHGYAAPQSVTFNNEPTVLLTRHKPA